jgi:formate hydrogenlyase subunit 4
VLDHSGPPLALILYSAAMKLFVFCAVVIGVAAPMVGGFDPWAAWGVFVAASLIIAVVIGVVESVMARLRLPQVPNLLVAACLMSAFGAILLMR